MKRSLLPNSTKITNEHGIWQKYQQDAFNRGKQASGKTRVVSVAPNNFQSFINGFFELWKNRFARAHVQMYPTHGSRAK